MIGTALILALTLFTATRLRGFLPAGRIALSFLIALGSPVLAVSAVARLGVQPGVGIVVGVFAVLAAAVWILTRTRSATPQDWKWLRTLAAAFAVASLSAFLGRAPASGILVDPWAHIAWSRNLPAVFDLYPPGFPAFFAVLGLDDPLFGPMRLSSFLLHSALAAQFLALVEMTRALWPGAAAALLYLVVPVAFTKFDPPRPGLFAGVFVASAWWMLLGGIPSRRWVYGSLAFSTCALLVTHVSPLEIAHLAAFGICVLTGLTGRFAGTRRGLLFSLAAGAALSLVISPWPFAVLFRRESIFLLPSAYAAAAPTNAVAVARMWGPGLTIGGAAAAAWFFSRFRTIPRETRGFLFGIALMALLLLVPAVMIAAGFNVPVPLAPYRFYLAAALPLAIGTALAGATAWSGGRAGGLGVAACAAVAIADLCLRPTFSLARALAALATVAAVGWFARRRGAAAFVTAAVLAGCLGIAARIVIWRPQPPAVVAGWPEIVALDALVPQRVIDGLTGRDGNVARHRAVDISPLHEQLDWCGDSAAESAEALHGFLAGANALPAYLVVGDAFADSWSLYAGQRDHLVKRGDLPAHPFWSAQPCPEPAEERIGKIRSALEARADVRREYSTDRVVVYRMD
jgi:hypothetical protein